MRGRSQPPVRSPRVFPLFVAALLDLLLIAGSAAAQIETREFFVDPQQSFVALDGTSRLALALPAPVGALQLPVQAQSDPAVAGFPLPALGLSDGTATTLEGGFYLTLALPTQPGLVGTVSGGEASQLLSVSNSGAWLPGGVGGPAPGQLAAEIVLPGLGISAAIVLRDLAFSGFDAGGVGYVSDEAFVFPTQPVFGDPIVATQAVSGRVDVSGLGFRGGAFVPEGSTSIVVPAESGSLTRLGTNDWRLVLPFTLAVDLKPSAPFAGGLELDLSGQVVATTVPEPGFASALVGGLLALVGLGRRGPPRRASLVAASSRSGIVLGLVLVATTPACDGSFGVWSWTDSNGNGLREIEELTAWQAGQGAGATATAANDDATLEIAESGQSPITTSCSAGSCSSSLSVAGSCGAIEEAVSATGLRLDLADGCSATATYHATGSATQSLFNQSGIDKTFLVTLRQYATDPTGVTLTATADGTPLTIGAPLEVVVGPGPALPLSIVYAYDYAADGPSDEVAGFSIEVSVPQGLCSNDLDCGDDGACVAGSCITAAPGSFCLSHADCDTTGLPCNATFSRCQAPSLWPNPCSFDWDCEGRCFSNTCSEGLLNHGCQVDADCDASAPICSGGFCSA
ncbi:MAG: hypothetical protein R3F35_12740 [Myxococcota bacterium]